MLQSSHSSSNSQQFSPSQSHQQQGAQISIEILVAWLLAAKRALSSIHHVHQATTILSQARTIIETTTALIARTKYLQRTLNSQLKILRAIQYELETAAQAVKIDVQSTIKDLQAADGHLAENIALLEQTVVESAFRIDGQTADKDVAQSEKQTLKDYVDDQPLIDLRGNIQSALKDADVAHADINLSIQGLEEDLQAINNALNERTATSSSTRSDLHPPHVPKVLKILEHHARVMAESLEGLVRHFDLCVTAIKHTEGGGAAVAQTVDPEDLPDGVDVHSFETPAQPIGDDEREEMLRVLETDAAEVDDVVVEIQERGNEMEIQLEHVAAWRESSTATYSNIVLAFSTLEKVSDRLSSHVAESTRFASQCATIKSDLEDCIAGMEELSTIYEAFLHAYDGMIVEAARRRTIRRKMERIVQEAQVQLDKLYEDDLLEREIFRTDRGGHLPGDIWQGLDNLPARFAFQRLNSEESASIPELPMDIVNAALKRLKAAQAS